MSAKKRLCQIALVFLMSPLIFACAHNQETVSDGLAEAVEVEEEDTQVAQEPSPQVDRVQKSPLADAEHPRTHVAVQQTPVQTAKVAAPPFKLNRYYFLRSNDTAEILSNLFYGSADRAAELVEWNGPTSKWQPGKVIYYRSAQHADDPALLSYYQEAGVQPSDIPMLPGDTLKTIASQRYGSAGSWRELAALNGMRSENEQALDGTLKAYPAELGRKNALPIQAKVPAPEKPQTASAGITGFAQKHPLAFGGGVALLAFSALFFFVQRYRNRRRFDF